MYEGPYQITHADRRCTRREFRDEKSTTVIQAEPRWWGEIEQRLVSLNFVAVHITHITRYYKTIPIDSSNHLS